ncbi:MAG: hypothetical protein GF383_02820 [Candidatus Lokiarchaeota archaeon]|nr:hypothetical protein [Candidatus Lokiarchaeota archaeon]MBD3338422.1 hypothetical protein [Candidatus Lokiarchaeota archaeon]
MSYLERTLAWWVRRRILGGLKKLRRREFFPFALIFVVLTGFTTTLSIMNYLNFIINISFLQSMLILQLFLSLAMIVSGLLIGKIKNLFIYFLIPILIFGATTIFFLFFDWNYLSPIFSLIKLSFFLIWLVISTISLFFLTLYFFTSFPKKIITLGMPKEHIFFGYIIKIVLLISIPIYIYIILRFSIGSLILGSFGILNSIIVYLLIKRAPKKFEETPSIVNFATAVGFFNVIAFYHLLVSFSSTSRTITSVILDISVVFIVILYLVQSLTMRISETPTRLEPHENPVIFQSRLYFTDRLKSTFGERGLIIMVLGLALGYHMVILDSFFIIKIPGLQLFFTQNLELLAIYHRIYLLFTFMITIFAILSFRFSKRFKEFMLDKYTLKQVIRYIGGFFSKQEEGITPFEYGVKAVKDKIGENVKKWSNKWQKSIKNIMNTDLDSDKKRIDEDTQQKE